MNIVLLDKVSDSDLEGSTFITGFQGFGMVGYLTSRHLVMELKLKRIGFVRTRYYPETTIYTRESGIVYPFELYYGVVEGRKILVLLNNGTPSVRDRTDYAEFIARWVKEKKISNAILVGGLDPSLKESEEEKYRWVPIGGYTGKLNAAILENRHVIGPLALMMIFMDAYKVPGVAVFAYTELYRPDPRASAVAVEVIGELLGLKIDTTRLLEEAKIIESIEAEREKMMKNVEVESSEKGHPIYL
ncbi:proteasome assembly chaperone family protein [Thermogladius sp. 4427co]|uniref:proteasome assembly chaperone family protein n=1 Tax=Thermogladius sp. 4427co TaxID=3450718 RepID=UPI003F7ACF8F